MSRRIKGITVEIGGDTTKLQDALKGVNKEIKDTQSQLRDVNKLLKLDPGNTELLVQKHKLLGQAIDETKQKLSTLKEASRNAQQALAQGDITQAQYDALQREIIETEEALKSLEKQAHSSNSTLANISVAGEKMQVTGQKITSAGQKMMPVTAAITGLGVAAVKMSSDFDTAMSQVQAVSGATGNEFEQLREKAREMGAKTKFSATDAAEAMNYMAMAGWKTTDMISGIDGVMNLAAASGEDLALTSDIITDALTAFGLQASDSARFADVMAATSSNANTNVAMMGETFKYAAPIAGALGYTIEDTALAIGLMANAGIKSSQAGTSLRTIMTELQGDLVVTSGSMGEMMIQTTNADGSMRGLNDILVDLRMAFSSMTEAEQVANAEMLVGKQAMSGFLAIMNAAPSDVDKLTNAIHNADGAAESMAKTMQDNLEGELEELMSALEELAISFGDILMPVVRAIVRGLNGFVNMLNALPGPIKGVVATILVLIAAVGPLLIIVGQMMNGFGAILIHGPKLIGMFSGISSFITSTLIPAIGSIVAVIGPIPLLIGGIIAAIALLWSKSDSFREGIINLWNHLKEATAKAWAAISQSISGAWTWMKETTSQLASQLVTSVKTTWQNLVQTLSQWTHQFITGIQQAWQAMVQFVSQVVQSLAQFVVGAWQNMTQTVGRWIDVLVDWVGSAWDNIYHYVADVVNNLASFVSDAWYNIVSYIGDALSRAVSFVYDAFQGMWSGASNGMSYLIDVIASGFNSAVSFIWNLLGQAGTWGWDLIIGICNGITSAIGHLIDSVRNVANIIWSYLHFSVPEIGPLTDYESWMPDFMEGLAKGIDRSKHLVANSMKQVAQDMVVSPQVPRVALSAEGGASLNLKGQLDQALSQIKLPQQETGDIVIPVYLGGTLLDEVIVNAQMRQNLRSGGR